MDLLNAAPEIVDGFRRLASSAYTEDRGDGFIADTLRLLGESLDLGVVYLTRIDQQTQSVKCTYNRAGMKLEPGDSGPLDTSYCIKLLQSGDRSLVVPDVQTDPWFSSLRATREIGIGAYTGIPLSRSDGEIYGTLCTLHPVSRTPLDGEVELLSMAGRLIMQAVEYEEKQEERRNRERAEWDRLLLSEQSAREQAEQELEQSRIDLQLAVDAARLGVWSLDLATGRLECSARCKSHFGMGADTTLSYDTLRSLVHPDDWGRLQTSMERAVACHDVFDAEYRVLRPDGSEHWLLSQGRAVYGPDGPAERVLGFTLEVTERKRADEAREAFFAAAAHDLKTPLTAIKGSAQILQRRLARSDGHNLGWALEAAERIDSAGTRLLSAVNSFIDSARIGTGQTLELRRSPVDLVALVCQVVQEQRQRSPHRSIEVDAYSGDVTGMWDRFRIERVVHNLLANAIRYSPNGGKILVTVNLEGERPPRAVLCVRDHGIGIPESDLPRVFERFYRGANVGQIEGTGIGLTGAKHIIEQHGGTIHVESSKDEGTAFAVSLPLVSWQRSSEET